MGGETFSKDDLDLDMEVPAHEDKQSRDACDLFRVIHEHVVKYGTDPESIRRALLAVAIIYSGTDSLER